MPSEQLYRLIGVNCPLSSRSIFRTQTNHQRIRPFSNTPNRAEATSKRLRRRLMIQQAPSMKTRGTVGPKTSHVIFNPPAAPPNVFHTPLKFLPKNDIRRKLYTSGPSLYNIPTSTSTDVGRYSQISEMDGLRPTHVARPGTALHEMGSTFPIALAPRIPDDVPLPPELPKQWKLNQVLTQADIDEIRRLRMSEPFKWTVTALCEKFECSAALVKAIAAPPASHERYVKKMAKVQKSWSAGRAKARQERLRREVLWGMDA